MSRRFQESSLSRTPTRDRASRDRLPGVTGAPTGQVGAARRTTPPATNAEHERDSQLVVPSTSTPARMKPLHQTGPRHE